MFTYISDDIKPTGCTFNSATCIFETLVLFHIAWAISNRFFFSSQTRQTLTTFTPYIPSKKKHYILLTLQINDKDTLSKQITYFLSI